MSWTGGAAEGDISILPGSAAVGRGVRVGAGRETAGCDPDGCGFGTEHGGAAEGRFAVSGAGAGMSVPVGRGAGIGGVVGELATCTAVGTLVGPLMTTLPATVVAVGTLKVGTLVVGVRVTASGWGNGFRSMAIMVASSRPSSARIWWRWWSAQAGSSDGGSVRSATCTSFVYALISASCWAWESCGWASAANATATRSLASSAVIAVAGLGQTN